MTRPSPWLAPALRLQSGLAAALMLGACVLGLLGVPLDEAAPGVLLAGVVFTGMPHGAFDLHVARAALAPRLGPGWWLAFGLVYLALASLVALAWSLAPGTTLAGFLLVAAVHFGLGDVEDGLVAGQASGRVASACVAGACVAGASLDGARVPSVLAYGLLPVLPPIVLHPAGSAPLLALLAGRSPAAVLPVVHAAAWLMVPWGLAMLWAVARAWRQGRPVLERLAGLAGVGLLPPLLSFGLYFASGHAVRHLLRMGARHSPDRPREAALWLARTLVPAGLLCAAGIALAGAWERDAASGALPATMAVLFRGLAALTLPHMALMPWLEAGVPTMPRATPDATPLGPSV